MTPSIIARIFPPARPEKCNSSANVISINLALMVFIPWAPSKYPPVLFVPPRLDRAKLRRLGPRLDLICVVAVRHSSHSFIDTTYHMRSAISLIRLTTALTTRRNIGQCAKFKFAQSSSVRLGWRIILSTWKPHSWHLRLEFTLTIQQELLNICSLRFHPGSLWLRTTNLTATVYNIART